MTVASRPGAATERLFETVVGGGYCIGCGVCTVADPQIKMDMDEYGRLQARLAQIPDEERSQVVTNALDICPFSENALNEDQIGRELFHQGQSYDSRIGYYFGCHAGYVREGDFREQGSSGGMASWILAELLELNLVDYVIHVSGAEDNGAEDRLFSYKISETVRETRNRSKSRYYPVEMSEVLSLVLETPGRYAIAGVPCFIKAARLLARQNPVIAERLVFFFALFCGQFKTASFAEYLIWQCGVKLENVKTMDFRKKYPDRPASSYGLTVVLKNGEPDIDKPMHEIYDHSWGSGLFKYRACDYCDDVVGETADVSLGDAWLPQYVVDSQGTNVIIVRHPVIRDMIREAMADGRLALDVIDPDTVVASQQGGFNHRRLTLPYRLFLADKAGKWRPAKRLSPDPLRRQRRLRKIQDLRIQLAEGSHEAWKQAVAAQDFNVFVELLGPLKQAYDGFYRDKKRSRKLTRRIKRRLKRLFERIRS
jgi:coenzyme F420 hydrogenase subunit beta